MSDNQIELNLIELWALIQGYSGDYLVSNEGRVKSVKFGKEKIMKQSKNGGGYMCVTLTLNGKQKTEKVHRLVGLTFLKNPANFECIDHKNGKRVDNRVANLRWVSRSLNARNIPTTGGISIATDGRKKKYRVGYYPRPLEQKKVSFYTMLEAEDFLNSIEHRNYDEDLEILNHNKDKRNYKPSYDCYCGGKFNIGNGWKKTYKHLKSDIHKNFMSENLH